MRSSLRQPALRRAGVGFVCTALFFATAIVVPAQDKAASPAAQPANPPQPVEHDYRFEVASVRLAPDQTGQLHGPGGPSYTPGHFRSETETIVSLAYKAFGRKQGYELKFPQWMWSTHFTINATIPDGATKADLPIMLQHLLEDRFALKYHHEMHQMDGFELVVAKSGPKLTKSLGPISASSPAGGPRVFPVIKDGVPQFAKDSGPGQLYIASPAGLVSWWHGRDESMQRFASDLAGRLRVPVSDGTGLEGNYDFSLNFIEERSSAAVAPAPAGSDGTPTPSDYAPLPTALEQQLGLKLKPVKNVPVDVVVLDSANKQPTDN